MNNESINAKEYTTKLQALHQGSITTEEWMQYCDELKSSIAVEKYINIDMAKGNHSQRKETKKPKKDKGSKSTKKKGMMKSYKRQVSKLLSKLELSKKNRDITKIRQKIEELRKARRAKDLKKTR